MSERAVEDSLLTRSGTATRAIARDLLARPVGDRIPSVTRYAASSRVGVHTVQRAIAFLRSSGTVDLAPRARSGTYLVAADRARLWSLAYGEPLVVYMPLPYSRRYEGLATGISEGLGSLGVPYRVAFMSGAGPRLEAAARSAGFAVVSALALRSARIEPPFEAVLTLPAMSYVSSHGVIRRRGPIPAKPLIGIDVDSIDQAALTKAEFGDEAEFRAMHYLQLVAAVRRGIIDATVWSLDSVSSDDQVKVDPLSSPAALELDDHATRAVFGVSSANAGIAELVRDCLDSNALIRIQQEVLAGDRLPSY